MTKKDAQSLAYMELAKGSIVEITHRKGGKKEIQFVAPVMQVCTVQGDDWPNAIAAAKKLQQDSINYSEHCHQDRVGIAGGLFSDQRQRGKL